MNINWYGQTCFRIGAQKNKNGLVNILIEPFLNPSDGLDGSNHRADKESGFRLPKFEVDILLLDKGFGNEKKEMSLVKGSNFLITGPGEYDVKGVCIQGISAKTRVPISRSGQVKGENTVIYTIKSEGIKICHLGRLGEEELSSDQVEKIGEVDILMIPIGGEETISAKEALKVMAQIEPKITIPMYYKVPKLNPFREEKNRQKGKRISKDVKTNLGSLDEFLKILGIKSLQPLAKLSIKKKDISKDEAKIIVLEV